LNETSPPSPGIVVDVLLDEEVEVVLLELVVVDEVVVTGASCRTTCAPTL
jgi:hypothetical protein